MRVSTAAAERSLVNRTPEIKWPFSVNTKRVPCRGTTSSCGPLKRIRSRRNGVLSGVSILALDFPFDDFDNSCLALKLGNNALPEKWHFYGWEDDFLTYGRIEILITDE